MAKDGLFFRSAGKLHPTYKAPAASLMVQMVWICILCVSGSYGQLLDYVVFAVLVFYILTIAGLFVLRFKRPEAERPYKAIGYPVVPAIFILSVVGFVINLLINEPIPTTITFALILLGVPVYFFAFAKTEK